MQTIQKKCDYTRKQKKVDNWRDICLLEFNYKIIKFNGVCNYTKMKPDLPRNSPSITSGKWARASDFSPLHFLY